MKRYVVENTLRNRRFSRDYVVLDTDKFDADGYHPAILQTNDEARARECADDMNNLEASK
jgi:hypothetical protein